MSLESLTRGLDTVLCEEVKKFTILYVDDCLCVSENIDEHLVHLRMLLNNIRRENVTVNLKKSKFFRDRINYLGYELTTYGISASTEKISAIMEFPRPKKPETKGFLGLTNFYNMFTSKYLSLIHIL